MKKKTEEKKPEESNLPQVKKKYSLRLFMLVVSGLSTVVGAVLFGFYFMNQNIAFGLPSILMVGGGIFVFKYYWSHADDVVTEHIGAVSKVQVNSMCIYQDRVIFEDVHEPEGFPWECMNDHKKYYVNIWGTAFNQNINRLVPFTLPDQQYYDPVVFAERVLALPAHRKIFRQREKLFQKIKTALLVVGILVVWLLIMTTSGS